MDQKSFMDKVSFISGIERETCNELLESLSETFVSSISSGQIISIPSFGIFEPRKRNERIMSHPSDPGKHIMIPPKIVVSFRPSNILKLKINNIDSDE